MSTTLLPPPPSPPYKSMGRPWENISMYMYSLSVLLSSVHHESPSCTLPTAWHYCWIRVVPPDPDSCPHMKSHYLAHKLHWLSRAMLVTRQTIYCRNWVWCNARTWAKVPSLKEEDLGASEPENSLHDACDDVFVIIIGTSTICQFPLQSCYAHLLSLSPITKKRLTATCMSDFQPANNAVLTTKSTHKSCGCPETLLQ